MSSSSDIQSVLDKALADPNHDWVMSSADVSEGYGISTSTLRTHKQKDELIEGQHWVMIGRATHWTKAGVIQLGFHIQSERGAKFRKMAETLVLAKLNEASLTSDSNTTGGGSNLPPTKQSLELAALDELAAGIATVIAPEIAKQHLRERVAHYLPSEVDKSLDIAEEVVGNELAAEYCIPDIAEKIQAAITAYRQQRQAIVA